MGSESTVHDTVKFLTWSFTKATMRAVSLLGNRAVRPSSPATTRGSWKLYEYQVEFSYILDEITRGSKYISTKNVHLANELIEEINNLVK